MATTPPKCLGLLDELLSISASGLSTSLEVRVALQKLLGEYEDFGQVNLAGLEQAGDFLKPFEPGWHQTLAEGWNLDYALGSLTLSRSRLYYRGRQISDEIDALPANATAGQIAHLEGKMEVLDFRLSNYINDSGLAKWGPDFGVNTSVKTVFDTYVKKDAALIAKLKAKLNAKKSGSPPSAAAPASPANPLAPKPYFGLSNSEVSALSKDDIAKLLADSDAIPEKTQWVWLARDADKQTMVSVLGDVGDAAAMNQWVLKAFEAEVNVLKKRIANDLAKGKAEAAAKKQVALAKAETKLAKANEQYGGAPPLTPAQEGVQKLKAAVAAGDTKGVLSESYLSPFWQAHGYEPKDVVAFQKVISNEDLPAIVKAIDEGGFEKLYADWLSKVPQPGQVVVKGADLGVSHAQLAGMKTDDIAKLLSQHPDVPEKGIWLWLARDVKKDGMVQVALDAADPEKLRGWVLKAFEARVKILSARVSKADAAGDTAKVANLQKQLGAAMEDLTKAKTKYGGSNPLSPGSVPVTATKLKPVTEEAAQAVDDLFGLTPVAKLGQVIDQYASAGNKAPNVISMFKAAPSMTKIADDYGIEGFNPKLVDSVAEDLGWDSGTALANDVFKWRQTHGIVGNDDQKLAWWYQVNAEILALVKAGNGKALKEYLSKPPAGLVQTAKVVDSPPAAPPPPTTTVTAAALKTSATSYAKGVTGKAAHPNYGSKATGLKKVAGEKGSGHIFDWKYTVLYKEAGFNTMSGAQKAFFVLADKLGIEKYGPEGVELKKSLGLAVATKNQYVLKQFKDALDEAYPDGYPPPAGTPLTPPAAPIEPVPPPTSVPPASPPTPPPLPPSQVTQWSVPQLKKGPANPAISGGAHTKEALVDQYENPWMGKPVSVGGWAGKGGAPDTAFLAKGEDAAHRIFHRVGLKVAESHVVDMNGRTYHVQKLWQGVKGDLGESRSVNPATLSTAERHDFMRHMLGDWLVGNHDGHGGNFLRLEDGSLVSIDKGQMFKFIGTKWDNLESFAFEVPSGNFGTPYSQTFWRAYERGDIDVDLHAADGLIDQIEALSDSEFAELIRGYAKGRATVRSLPNTMKKLDEDELIELALKRKRQIREDWEAFLARRAKAAGRVYEPRGARAPAATRKATQARTSTPEGVFRPIDQEFANAVDQAGVYGQAAFVPGAHVEYGQILIHVEEVEGKRRLVASTQTVAEGDRIVTATLSGSNPEIAKLRSSMPSLPPKPVASDFTATKDFPTLAEVHNNVVAGAKTLATHVTDGAYNHTTLANMQNSKIDLEAVLDEGSKFAKEFEEAVVSALGEDALPQAKAAAQYYVDKIDEIEKGVATHTKLEGLIEPQQYVDADGLKKLAAAEAQWEIDNANILAAREAIEDRIASIDPSGGLAKAERAKRVAEAAEVSPDGVKRVRQQQARAGADEYVVTADGVRISYADWESNPAISWKGHLEARLDDWDGSADQLNHLLDVLSRTGIETRAATEAEVALTYHRVLAGTAKGKRDGDRSSTLGAERKVNARLDKMRASGEDVTPEVEVRVWQEELEQALGTKLPEGYWRPRFALSSNSRQVESGHGVFYRPHGSGEAPEDLREVWGDRFLHHAWHTSFEDMLDAMRRAGTPLGKKERLRHGVIKSTGASEDSDLRGGGGSYVYTRVVDSPSDNSWGTSGFIISPRAAYRLGTYIHRGDVFGRYSARSDSFVLPTKSEVRALRGSNETDVRHSVSMFDDLEAIVVRNETEKSRMLDALREGGMPDVVRGAPLKDRVVVGSRGASAFRTKYAKSIYGWED